jgi:hypothetical protein
MSDTGEAVIRRIEMLFSGLEYLQYSERHRSSEEGTRYLCALQLVFSKTPPARRAFIAGVANGSFVIPPSDPNYKTDASSTFDSDVKLLTAGPHMHLRGKAMTMRAVYPTGESETLFDVPHYDFNWQQMYEFATPKTMPRGTRLELTAVYDNSPNNPANPDPKAEVRWGDQSYEEMMLGGFAVQIDPQADLDKLFAKPQKKTQVADAR